MKQIDQTAEIKRLQEALKENQKRADKAEAKNQALNDKLNAKRKELKVAKCKLKKKTAQKVVLTEEQKQQLNEVLQAISSLS